MLYRRVATLLFFLLSVALGAADDFRCVSCAKVVDRGYQVESKFYCPACLNNALPRCHNCSVPIQGNYVAVTVHEYPVCLTCRNSLPQCFICSLPCDGNRGGIGLADGRYACGEHSRNGVTDQATARQIFSTARKELNRTFGGALDIRTPIKEVVLVDIQGLIRASRDSSHNASLSGGKVLGIATVTLVKQSGRTVMEPSSVHLLNHVPADRLLTVCTHEYAHVWHAENHRDYTKTKPILREGFAEWVAYKVAQAHNRQDQMDLILNPNGGIYYQGLQKLLELERQKGVHGVLEYAVNAYNL